MLHDINPTTLAVVEQTGREFIAAHGLPHKIEATTSDGQPIAVEFSLDLVDKAVLSLLPRPVDAILEAFYGFVGAFALPIRKRIEDKAVPQNRGYNVE